MFCIKITALPIFKAEGFSSFSLDVLEATFGSPSKSKRGGGGVVGSKRRKVVKQSENESEELAANLSSHLIKALPL